VAIARTLRSAPPELPELREIAGRVAPVALAGEQLLPVVPALQPLFPSGGLRRGSVVGVSFAPGTDSVSGIGGVSLALAILAGPSSAGSWTALVGLPTIGGVAAGELGIDLARFALVPAPGPAWPTVVAALLDAIDVVAVHTNGVTRVRAADARRLAARARERGAVLVVVGPWAEGPDVRLSVVGATWTGLGRGHGRLQARRLEVVGGGRGAAARERRVFCELDGGV
jgi:hypothetical protein